MPLVHTTYTGMFKNCSSLIIAHLSETDASSVEENMVFAGCSSLISLSEHPYFFKEFKFGNAVYQCVDDKNTVSILAETMLNLWNEYYINNSVYDDEYYKMYIFDLTPLFDYNNDNIVNAKDYALLMGEHYA